MKKLLVTDSHLGISKSSDMYHDIVLQLFKDIQKTCFEQDINEIFHLGDFFHDRRVLNTKTQAVAHEIARLFDNNFIFYIILGNHDCYYKDKLEPNVAELLKQYSTFRIIDKITVIENNIVLCPWGIIPTGFNGEYCFGHFEFTGFKMNNSYLCERGTDVDIIKPCKFKHIYSGHFHTPSNKDNVTYLGSPYQMTFADINSKRGYYIWDNGKLDFIQFHYAPEFKIVETDKLDSAEIATNIVRLVFTEDYGSMKNQQIIDQVLCYNPVRLQVDFSKIKIEGTEDKMEENTDATLLDHDGIIIEYINKTETPSHIKKKTLLSMIDKLRGQNG